MGETDAQVNQKLHAALAAGLIPIVCLGELLEERQGGRTEEVVRTQLEGSLAGLSAEQMGKTVLAYFNLTDRPQPLPAGGDQGEVLFTSEGARYAGRRSNSSM